MGMAGPWKIRARPSARRLRQHQGKDLRYLGFDRPRNQKQAMRPSGQATSDKKLAQRLVKRAMKSHPRHGHFGLERSCLKLSEWTASLNRVGKEAGRWSVVGLISHPLLFALYIPGRIRHPDCTATFTPSEQLL